MAQHFDIQAINRELAKRNNASMARQWATFRSWVDQDIAEQLAALGREARERCERCGAVMRGDEVLVDVCYECRMNERAGR